jgi:sugar phosphate isomerase/epimerase
MLNIGANVDEQGIDGDLDSLRQYLSCLAKNEFEVVELPIHGLDVIRCGKIDQRALREVLTVLADFPFRYTVHAPHALNLMDSRDRSTHVDVLRSSLEFASHINASALVYHPGRYVPEELFFFGQALKQPEDKKKYLRDMEASAIRLVSEDFPNVLICMENARPYLFHSPYCYAEFLESLKEQVVKIDRPNVRMTIDFGHLYLAAGFYDFEPIQSIRGASALIAHAHIHDNFGIPTYYNETEPSRLIPFGKGDCHMPIGWGTRRGEDTWSMQQNREPACS